MRTFAPANKENQQGALVQLVRIHACHAWGHGFESRTHRKRSGFSTPFLFSPLFCFIAYSSMCEREWAKFLMKLVVISEG